MSNLLASINLLLAQTAQEKRLTVLYVTLFAFLVLLLVLDSRDANKWVGGNKIWAKIFIVLLVIVLIVLVVLYFVL